MDTTDLLTVHWAERPPGFSPAYAQVVVRCGAGVDIRGGREQTSRVAGPSTDRGGGAR